MKTAIFDPIIHDSVVKVYNVVVYPADSFRFFTITLHDKLFGASMFLDYGEFKSNKSMLLNSIITSYISSKEVLRNEYMIKVILNELSQ